MRDACIQRFEFTFELLWKTIQAIARREGLVTNSPRAAFRAGFQLGLMDDTEVWFEMMEDRNLTSHTYNEVTAKRIYCHLPAYSRLLRETRDRVRTYTSTP